MKRIDHYQYKEYHQVLTLLLALTLKFYVPVKAASIPKPATISSSLNFVQFATCLT
jgi:hypothetical protein